ncbi:MAG: D-isomer specific 2-hydroxyacid dehydrogenase NAD-binding [Xanthobacteraceae bacterium]|jgi:D-3-phosphoglycerate dehydrogenase|nr:D-isomer specific 2-hydroxyacid dehydrogenase NAD-binding [Xanthobacteraceae bacterium]
MTATDRNVLVTLRFFDNESMAILRDAGCTVTIHEPPPGANDGAFSPAELKEMLAGKQGWIVGHAWVTREVLESAPQLAVVARRGVGYERVDAVAAKELGKVVTIAAGGNAPSVADQAIGLMIGIGRRFREQHERMAAGDWTILVGTELYRSTVGLIGFGRIARQLARRLKGFETEILAYSPRLDAATAAEYGVRPVDLPSLLRESDYVSVHAPLNASTRHLVDPQALSSMKKTAILVNTSRGGLVDETALLAALRAGAIAGAALDVFEGEIDPAMRAVAQELLKLPNFIGQPHSGASTSEALGRSNVLAARSIAAVLTGTPPVADCVIVDGRAPASVSEHQGRETTCHS